MTVFFVLIVIVAILLFSLLLRRDKTGYSVLQFYARGKDSGFKFREIELLRRIALKTELKDPLALFWSVRQLDLCIKTFLLKSRLTGTEEIGENQHLLAKLYAYRKKIEFDQPRYRKGISSTRSISDGQKLRFLLEGSGVFSSSVVRNTDKYLTIAKPPVSIIPMGTNWKGCKLSVYFWRRDDAGYVFDTYVLEDIMVHGGALLHLSHSDSLFRTQKRRSVRAKKQISAYLYLPRAGDAPEKVEVEPGLRCIVEDLSEDGCALTVGGKAPNGLRVKVQFEIEGEAVVMSGELKSSEYNPENNRSRLHVQAHPLSLATRNRILMEVFNLQPGDGLGEDYGFFNDEDESEGSAPDAGNPGGLIDPSGIHLDRPAPEAPESGTQSAEENKSVQTPEDRDE